MTELWFILPGVPVAKGRPRAGKDRRTGKVRMYTPRATRAYEAAVMRRAKVQLEDQAERLPDGPIECHMLQVMPRTKDLQRPSKPAGRIWCSVKPDRDNVEKAVLDGLEAAGVITNDSRICTGGVHKVYAARGEAPHVEVVLRPAPQRVPQPGDEWWTSHGVED